MFSRRWATHEVRGISMMFGECLSSQDSGLPPLIIRAGTHEVLLDDAVRLARQAAIADVEVTLDVTPRVPHVFQAYYPILDEAAPALDRAGQLLSAHMASAERVTA
jgi:epsilon-lactone hydrolase